MRILIVEDDPETAHYVSRGLTEAGHLAVHAASGDEGLFRAAGEPFDLLIIDRMLPNLYGVGLVQTLRSAGNHTPILFLTALGGVDDRVAFAIAALIAIGASAATVDGTLVDFADGRSDEPLAGSTLSWQLVAPAAAVASACL